MAATNVMGISSIGGKFGWAVETTAGTKPEAFTQIERCNSISGIDVSVEQIDASALEDSTTKYIAGRSEPASDWNVSFNLTDDVQDQLEAMMSAYEALTGGKKMWFTVWLPDLADGFFMVGAPPAVIPMPEVGQNELMTVEIPITVEDYKGLATKIEPTRPN